MRKITLVLAASATLLLLDGQPSQAGYYDGAWCAVSSQGRGGATENCGFNSFEACRNEIVAGNRGFCRQNGRWSSAQAAAPRYKARKRAYR